MQLQALIHPVAVSQTSISCQLREAVEERAEDSAQLRKLQGSVGRMEVCGLASAAAKVSCSVAGADGHA